MAKRHFYVVYIGEHWLQVALDVVRFIADPSERRLAHITVRGPYSEPPDLPALLRDTDRDPISLTGASDFFQSGQNTVFLACDSPVLRDRWDKGDYGYQPHITLYDGRSRTFAVKLRRLLDRYRLSGTFMATRLSLLTTERGAPDRSLREGIVAAGLSSLIDDHVTVADVEDMDDSRRLKLIERVISHIANGLQSSRRGPNKQQPLFDVSDPLYARARPTADHSVLPLIVAAYRDVHNGRSIDRIIADPEANLDYIKACWHKGLRLPQYQLNRSLLNARKQGLIGRVAGIERYSIARADLDRYSFASEVALRLTQDEERVAHQRSVGLDMILCHPGLSYRFNQLAQWLAPGFGSAEYRWAALSIRKSQARRTPTDQLVSPRFESIGSLASFRAGVLASAPGVFRLSRGSSCLFIGEAEDLRLQLELVSQTKLHELPVLRGYAPAHMLKLHLDVAEMTDSSPSWRSAWKALWVQQNSPDLNVLPHVRTA